MPDIATLVRTLMADGTIRSIATNPRAQFGVLPRRYIGAELLPERTVTENAFREEDIRYRTVIANSGSRYSPAQKKGNELVGSFLVELGDNDIASELTARAYDTLIKVLGGGADMDAVAQITSWAERTLNLPLAELNEKHRWDAIVDASVVRTGDNAYSETVTYPNPSNHRAAAASQWSNDANDPFVDFYTMSDLLTGKGFTVSRIITSRPVVTILANNAKVQARTGLPVMNVGGTLGVSVSRASQDGINNALARDGLPMIETYDLQYRTQTGTGYFLKRDVVVFVCTTGRDETLDLGDDGEITLADTLGYTAIGRAAGQATPGRVIRMESFTNKPPRVEGEAWETTLPVIQEPEAIAVVHTIT